jgi:hypothetical protein
MEPIPPKSPLEDVGRRAFLPAVMGPPDVRQALGLASDRAARELISSGGAGPYIRRGRRVYVLRSTFLAHLEAQAVRERAPRSRP